MTDLDELREIFDHYDKDGNGRIDRSEFASLMMALGGAADPDEAAIGFQEIDGDRSGSVDFKEFASWWEDRQ